MRLFIFIILLAASNTFILADTIWHTVAYDNYGNSDKPRHVLDKPTNYQYSKQEIDLKTIALNSTMRSVIYNDSQLKLVYGGLKATTIISAAEFKLYRTPRLTL